MKLAARIGAILALVAFAVPALACNEGRGMSAGASDSKAAPESKPAIAKAEKKAVKTTPAQSESKKN
jgi:hypothetical protein